MHNLAGSDMFEYSHCQLICVEFEIADGLDRLNDEEALHSVAHMVRIPGSFFVLFCFVLFWESCFFFILTLSNFKLSLAFFD
jgi:hypothetical protein